MGQSFWDCTGILEASFSASLTSIASSAFQGCTVLSAAKFKGTPPSVGNYAFANVASGARGHYPKTLLSAWLPQIGSDGKWNGLIMHELSQPILRVDSASPVDGTITLAWDDGTDGQCVSSYSIYRGAGTEQLPEYCVASNITGTTWTDNDYLNAEPVFSPLNYWVVAESDHFDLPESNRVETRHRYGLFVGTPMPRATASSKSRSSCRRLRKFAALVDDGRYAREHGSQLRRKTVFDSRGTVTASTS